MDRRNFLASTGRLMLVTSGLFITGKAVLACHHDDDSYGGYYNGYYNGYYDDKQAVAEPQNPASQNQHQNQKSQNQHPQNRKED